MASFSLFKIDKYFTGIHTIIKYINMLQQLLEYGNRGRNGGIAMLRVVVEHKRGHATVSGHSLAVPNVQGVISVQKTVILTNTQVSTI